MQTLKKYLFMVIPAFIMVVLIVLEPHFAGLGTFMVMARLLVLFECLTYYLVIGFSKLYNPNVDFESSDKHERTVASIITGVHVLVAVLILGVYFAV